MADAKYYFIYHIDMYQGTNTENIDIYTSLHNPPVLNLVKIVSNKEGIESRVDTEGEETEGKTLYK